MTPLLSFLVLLKLQNVTSKKGKTEIKVKVRNCLSLKVIPSLSLIVRGGKWGMFMLRFDCIIMNWNIKSMI